MKINAQQAISNAHTLTKQNKNEIIGYLDIMFS